MTTASSSATSSAALHRILWRLHFWAGVIGAPIVVFAALTGLLYAVSPQVEAVVHRDLDSVQVGREMLSLDEQIERAMASAPDSELRFVVPPMGPGQSTQVYVTAPHEHHARRGQGHEDHGLPTGYIVYVDPYSGQVLGQLQELQRFKTWAKKLHSSALQGNGWRWLLELGASWMLVLLLSGVVLWWPRSQARGGQGWRALLPRAGSGRATWRGWHALVALTTSLLMALVLVTGLTWSRHSGAQFRELQNALGHDTRRIPSPLVSTSPTGPTLSWQSAWQHAKRVAPEVAVQMTAPQSVDGYWRVENFDRSQPTKRFTMALDARDGATLFYGGWQQMPALSKATAIGIPFHRGEFGLWNQALLAILALSALFSVWSGLTMWSMRRPRARLAAPAVTAQHVHQAPLWLWPSLAALGLAMPVFGWSLAALLLIELAWRATESVRATQRTHKQ